MQEKYRPRPATFRRKHQRNQYVVKNVLPPYEHGVGANQTAKMMNTNQLSHSKQISKHKTSMMNNDDDFLALHWCRYSWEGGIAAIIVLYDTMDIRS